MEKYFTRSKNDLSTTKSPFANQAARLTLYKCQAAHNFLKEQVQLIESSQGLHELSYMYFLVMILTFYTFLTLSPIFRGEFPHTLVLLDNSAIVLAALLCFYFKCHYAEEITEHFELHS